MNNWIDVPDIQPGDTVIIDQEPARVNYIYKNAAGDYVIGYWNTKRELKMKTFMAVTSLQKAI